MGVEMKLLWLTETGSFLSDEFSNMSISTSFYELCYTGQYKLFFFGFHRQVKRFARAGVYSCLIPWSLLLFYEIFWKVDDELVDITMFRGESFQPIVKQKNCS